MIFAITAFLMNRGVAEATAKRVARWLFIAIVVIALIVVIVLAKSCYNRLNPGPKLNEAEIQKAQDAIAKQDRVEMQKILVDSDVKEQRIDGNLANAETAKINALAEARKRAAEMTNDELAAELERRTHE